MNNNEIHVIYGNKPIDMIKELLNKINLKDELKQGMKVGIKPNLVVAKPAQYGATTHTGIVEGLVRYLKDNGIKDITIMESSWVGENTKRAFKICGYEELARKYDVGLYDLKEDTAKSLDAGNMKLKVCSKALEMDYLINVPVLKAHCQTLFTCALKNMKGCIPDGEKRRFHTLGLHKPIAYLSKILKGNLIIVDALCGDLTFEEGGNPVRMDRIIAGKDPVLVDSYGASLLGYTKDDIEYIKIAEQLGSGSADIDKASIYEYNADLKNVSKIKPSGLALKLAEKVEAKDACSACYGSLMHALKRLDEKGELKKINQKILIGQGYRGKTERGIGIGNCTAKCSQNVKGCPPSAVDIIHYIENLL